jgi:hypothetical protein
MAPFDLNLSTRPFPAYRLINIGLVLALVLLIGISAWQAVGFVRFSNMAAGIRPAEEEVLVEAESLRRQFSELGSRLDGPEATAKLNEIGFLNQLIARKNLSWTGLFADIESIIPDSVHLVTLTPVVDREGAVLLRMTLQGRSLVDVTEFVERLEQSPVFENVVLSAEGRDELSQDVDLSLATNYFPERENR